MYHIFNNGKASKMENSYREFAEIHMDKSLPQTADSQLLSLVIEERDSNLNNFDSLLFDRIKKIVWDRC